ncbi:MAG: hypothetical protein ACT4P5_22745 [Armatimonadota bacterium]
MRRAGRNAAAFVLVLTVFALLAYAGRSDAGPSGQARRIGPILLLQAGAVDRQAQTVTLPLLMGRMQDGKKVWYVVTDASDRRIAVQRGINHSPKLANAPRDRGPRQATREADGTLTFESGTVDFGPVRAVTAGAPLRPFPPKVAQPGSVGDADYTPVLRFRNAGDAVYNAPIVAFGVEPDQISFCAGKPDLTRVHDRVVRICPEKGTVTLALTPGFSVGREVLYISTESTDRGVAAMEAATFAPRLADASPAGGYGEHSQVEPIVVVINGPTGLANPQRQGLESALVDGRAPLNVVGAIPTLGEGYSPLWSVNLARWSEKAIGQGRRVRVTGQVRVQELVQRGWITGPDGKAFGAVGVIVNCPIVQRLQ